MSVEEEQPAAPTGEGREEGLEIEPSLSVRLARAYGDDVDPGISLEPRGSSPAEGSTTISRKERLEKLEAHTPILSRYRVLGEIARGGMGAVLKVWDEDLRRTLAMKVVLGRDDEPTDASPANIDPEKLSRFLEEAQITGQLDHPGIVPIHDLGLDSNKRVYFTMPFIRGKDLKQIFEDIQEGRDDWTKTRCLPIFIRICEAMAFAHSKGVIHRDLKPSNIMVGRFGEAYVMDWGLAKVLGRHDQRDVRPRKEPITAASGASLVQTDRRDEVVADPDSPVITMDGDVVGTPAYMSPEQARGKTEELDNRADVYSLGAMLYHMLCGQMPFVPPGERVSPYTVLNAVRQGPPKALHQIDRTLAPELVAICEKAMARDLSERYRGPRELGEDLRNFIEGRVVNAYETGVVARLRKWVDRNRGMAAFIAISLLLAFGGLSYVLAVQIEHNNELQSKNAELEREEEAARLSAEAARLSAIEAAQQRDRADELRALAEEQEQLARERGILAEEAALEARRTSYLALVRLADSSLRLNDTAGAKRHLGAVERTMRGWEYRHLELRADTSLNDEPFDLSVLSASGPYRTLFSPDGSIGAWYGRTAIALFDPRRRLALSSWNTPGLQIVCAGFDPAGEVLAVGGVPGMQRTGFLQVWDVDGERDLLGTHQQHRTTIRDVVVLDGAEEVLSIDAQGILIEWSVPERAVTRTKAMGGADATAHAISADGRRVAIANRDGTIGVWSVATGYESATLPGHAAEIRSLRFDAQARRLLSTSADNTCKLWDLGRNEEITTLVGHTAEVLEGCFGPDGATVVTASSDQTARMWDVTTGALLNVFRGHVDTVQSVAVHPDGTLIATSGADQAARFWDPLWSRDQILIEGHAMRVNDLEFRPDGRELYTASEDRSILRWDVPESRLLSRNIDNLDGVRRIALSDDGRVLASAGRDELVRVWRTADDELLFSVNAHERGITALAIDPTGSRVATACGGRSEPVRIWDVASGELVNEIDAHSRSITDVVFSDGGRTLITCSSSDSFVRIWDVESGEQLLELDGDGDRFECVDVSVGRVLVAAGGKDNRIHLWDGSSGETFHVLEGHEGTVQCLDFSRNTTRLASGSADGTVRLWLPASGQELFELRVGDMSRAHLGGDDTMGVRVRQVAFSPDGSRLAAGTWVTRAEVDNMGEWGLTWIWETGGGEDLAARANARRSASETTATAAALFEGLRQDLGLVDDVIQALQDNPSLPDALRESALNFAGLDSGPYNEMMAEAWAVSRRAGSTRSDYVLALEKALEAVDHDAGNKAYAVSKASSEYRLGRYLDAYETLVASAELSNSHPTDMPLPYCFECFHAMVLERLGRHDEAVEMRDRALGSFAKYQVRVAVPPAWIEELHAELEALVVDEDQP